MNVVQIVFKFKYHLLSIHDIQFRTQWDQKDIYKLKLKIPLPQKMLNWNLAKSTFDLKMTNKLTQSKLNYSKLNFQRKIRYPQIKERGREKFTIEFDWTSILSLV
jgi:hypothetical protein